MEIQWFGNNPLVLDPTVRAAVSSCEMKKRKLPRLELLTVWLEALL